MSHNHQQPIMVVFENDIPVAINSADKVHVPGKLVTNLLALKLVLVSTITSLTCANCTTANSLYSVENLPESMKHKTWGP